MHATSVILLAWALISAPAADRAPAGKKRPSGKAATAKQSRPRLTVRQLEQLISIKTPDGVVAQEIRNRNVEGAVTRQLVLDLKRRGAGSETVIALTALIARSTLIVKTNPGADVTLDGVSAGSSGPDGQLQLDDLDPGVHSVEVMKSSFRPHSASLQLPPNRVTTLNADLEWAVGFLSVGTNVTNARIHVGGSPPQTGSVTRLAVPTGQVLVTVTAPYRKVISQPVTIEPGKDRSLLFSLDPDQEALGSLAKGSIPPFDLEIMEPSSDK